MLTTAPKQLSQSLLLMPIIIYTISHLQSPGHPVCTHQCGTARLLQMCEEGESWTAVSIKLLGHWQRCTQSRCEACFKFFAAQSQNMWATWPETRTRPPAMRTRTSPGPGGATITVHTSRGFFGSQATAA